MMISYALDGEDVVCARAFARVPRGRYVDVGAGDGRATRHLHEHGWQGVCVEGDPDLVAKLMGERPHATVLGFDASAATLREARGFVGTPDVDLLRIGSSGLTWSAAIAPALVELEPRVVILQVAAANLQDVVIGRLLQTAGYVVASDDGVNSYLAHANDAEVLSQIYPACSRDEYVTADHEAIATENRRLREELERIGGEIRERPGGDRAVLAAPSVQARRFAMRHDLVQTPFISLDRVAVIATHETGGRELAELLAGALEVQLLELDHPADLDFDHLPAQVVIWLQCPFSELSRLRLNANAFRIVSTARHPLDSLAAYRRVAAPGDSESELARFVAWAASPEAGERLDINGRWLVEPGTIRVDFDEMRLDPYTLLVKLYEDLGISVENVTALARRVSEISTRVQTSLEAESPIPRSLFSDANWSLLVDVHGLAFTRLGFEMHSVVDDTSLAMPGSSSLRSPAS